MKHYVYPGSFCPPTYGHLRIVRRAAELLPSVTVVCSTNQDKVGRWFSETECKLMWSAYQLPDNVVVKTFDELHNNHDIALCDCVMIRGIRNADDYVHEQRVMELNYNKFGISNYLYVIAEPEFANISSSLVRKDAEKLSLETLYQYVAPTIISSLLEHVLGIKNIIMVVGRPASGKTTFLRMLQNINSCNTVIETDQWSDCFKPFLTKHFACDDLIRLSLERDKEVSQALKDMWIAKLKESLSMAPRGSSVFVEAAYGLSANKSLFRFLGGKVLYLGCEDEEINKQRMIARGTPELVPFIKRIPNLEGSRRIAEENNLSLLAVNTLCAESELKEKASSVSATVNQNHWKEDNQ